MIHGVLIAGLRPGGFGSLFEEDEIEGGSFPRVWTCGAVGCDAWGCIALAWGCGDRGNQPVGNAVPPLMAELLVRSGARGVARLPVRAVHGGPAEDAVNAGRGVVVEAAKGFPAPFQGLGLRLVLLDERGNELLLPRGLEAASAG